MNKYKIDIYKLGFNRGDYLTILEGNFVDFCCKEKIKINAIKRLEFSTSFKVEKNGIKEIIELPNIIIDQEEFFNHILRSLIFKENMSIYKSLSRDQEKRNYYIQISGLARTLDIINLGTEISKSGSYMANRYMDLVDKLDSTTFFDIFNNLSVTLKRSILGNEEEFEIIAERNIHYGDYK